MALFVEVANGFKLVWESIYARRKGRKIGIKFKCDSEGECQAGEGPQAATESDFR